MNILKNDYHDMIKKWSIGGASNHEASIYDVFVKLIYELCAI